MQEVINTICIIVCIVMIIRILYPLCIDLIFILLIELNFRIYERRCHKFFKLAENGMCYREEFGHWFDVESKAYRQREDRIDRLHSKFTKSKDDINK